MEKEVWKEIEGFSGYFVSNLGRVSENGRIVPILTVGHGYKAVHLGHGSNQTTKTLHRLVALAFVPNPNNKPEVNHINEDKSDNRAENLNWMTRKENINHGTRTQRQRMTLKSTLGNRRKKP